MNLFDILSAGKQKLNEENVSALLAWLLDPGQSHGRGSLFLKRFLRLVEPSQFEPWFDGLNDSVAYRTQNKTRVTVLMENRVPTATGRIRDIDIVIILEKDQKSQIIAIENKIRDDACEEAQLLEELEGLTREYPDPNAIRSFVYITPRISPKAMRAFNRLPDTITKRHLIWADANSAPSSDPTSIVGLLRRIIEDDNAAQIDPLSHEVLFVLKSFIRFAENGFQSQINKGSTLMPGSKYFKDTVAGLEGLRTFLRERQDVYIGYEGGMRALKQADIEQLEDRIFKWDDALEGKIRSNWIPAQEMQQFLDERG